MLETIMSHFVKDDLIGPFLLKKNKKRLKGNKIGLRTACEPRISHSLDFNPRAIKIFLFFPKLQSRRQNSGRYAEDDVAKQFAEPSLYTTRLKVRIIMINKVDFRRLFGAMNMHQQLYDALILEYMSTGHLDRGFSAESVGVNQMPGHGKMRRSKTKIRIYLISRSLQER